MRPRYIMLDDKENDFYGYIDLVTGKQIQLENVFTLFYNITELGALDE